MPVVFSKSRSADCAILVSFAGVAVFQGLFRVLPYLLGLLPEKVSGFCPIAALLVQFASSVGVLLELGKMGVFGFVFALVLGLAVGTSRTPGAAGVIAGIVAFLVATAAVELCYHLALRTFDAGQLALLSRAYYQQLVVHYAVEAASFGLGLFAGSQAKTRGI